MASLTLRTDDDGVVTSHRGKWRMAGGRRTEHLLPDGEAAAGTFGPAVEESGHRSPVAPEAGEGAGTRRLRGAAVPSPPALAPRGGPRGDARRAPGRLRDRHPCPVSRVPWGGPGQKA
ncbi:hypothetical protein GCM10010275_19000 [Streptomyces litmocidini]|nr:hypothetical protein GCM10010275_19000 [Streptomyces litmocidini]